MYQQIKTFLAIVENKSISDAARALHYTQSTVSTYLNLLENRLGMTLVNRTRGKREVTITADGEAFIPLAQRFVDLEASLDQFIQSRQRRFLRFAASVSAHEHIVSHITHLLIRRMPDIELRLCNVEAREVNRAITERMFDVMVLHGPPFPEHPNITCIPLFYEERYILCRTDSNLPEGIVYPQDLDPAFEICYTAYTNSVIKVWHEQHFPEIKKPFFEISSWFFIYNYMTDPRCWAVVPASIAQREVALHPDKLTFRKIHPAPKPRACHLVVSNTYSDSKVIEELRDCFREYIEQRPYLIQYEE